MSTLRFLTLYRLWLYHDIPIENTFGIFFTVHLLCKNTRIIVLFLLHLIISLWIKIYSQISSKLHCHYLIWTSFYTLYYVRHITCIKGYTYPTRKLNIQLTLSLSYLNLILYSILCKTYYLHKRVYISHKEIKYPIN